MGVSAAEAKLPVAMRLPRYEVDLVGEFAERRGISKTDAFLYFLRKGIEAERGPRVELGHIEASLAEILALLKKGERDEKGNAFCGAASVSAVIAREAANFSAVKRALLFGSFARGEATSESDVDIRLELDEDEPFSLYDLARFQKAIEQSTGREVDVVTAQVIANENLACAIRREGVVVYEREA